MREINFNDLSDDLKNIIFKINRDDAVIKSHKKRFKNVLNDLNNINDEIIKYKDISDYKNYFLRYYDLNNINDDIINDMTDDIYNYYHNKNDIYKVLTDFKDDILCHFIKDMIYDLFNLR